jgi:hypothetical protein
MLKRDKEGILKTLKGSQQKSVVWKSALYEEEKEMKDYATCYWDESYIKVYWSGITAL